MDESIQQTNNRRKIIFIALIVFIIIGLVLLFASLMIGSKTAPFDFGEETLVPTSAPYGGSGSSTSPFLPPHKIIPGKTTREEVENLKDIKVLKSSNSETEYGYSSFLTPRPNKIIVRQGIAVFEGVLSSPDQNNPTFTTISTIKTQIGEPEETVKGSAFYGFYAYTYAYAKRGFAFIGNPNTDEIFEVHYFAPTTFEKYKSEFGLDINTERDDDHTF